MNEQRESNDVPNYVDGRGRKQAHAGDLNFTCGCSITGAPVYCPDHRTFHETLRVQLPHESAQSCGCDAGASYKCLRHRTNEMELGHPAITAGHITTGQYERPAHADVFVDVARTPHVQDATRKTYPVTSGVLDYFPLALLEIARVSHQGNEQHNPGQPLHWDRSKSWDQADCLVRHLLERGTLDTDGMRHSAKVAWRALALLQLELEAEGK